MRARDQRRMADVRVVWCGALCLLVALWSCDEGGQRGEQMTNVDPIEDRDMGSFDVLGDLSSDEDVLDEEVDASLVDCLGDDDCDDGVFCNGAERCFEGVCYENPQRVCVDLTDCTVDVCDEEGDACAYTPDAGLCGAGQVCDPKAGCFTPRECVRDEDCDDGVFCDGEERCVEERCAPGEPPSCADEVGCTVDGCVESARQCQRTPDNTLCLEGELCDPEQGGCVPQPPCAEDADCDDGRFCNGVERCDQAQGACVSGAPPAVEDGIGCTLDGCDESRGEVVHVPSAARCDNGLFCDGVERCDVEAGCVAGAAPTVDDGVVCTADACDEEVDEVVHVAQDGVCDNGLFCDGVERCDVEAGCVGGAAPEVDDGVDCTEDACDEEADEVVHSPSDVACDNGLFCDGVERCDVVEGCVAGAAVLLEDGLACTEGRCDEAQDQVVQLPLHERCDNGLFCDGAERCDAVEGCVAGGAPVVDDGVDCTEDACDEEADEVVHRPLDARCDDGQLCSGEERCDVVLGCLDGDALELDDGVLCTVDRCDDATGEVSHVPLDGRCDDGLFCNGVETCDVNGGCRPGVPPVVDDGVSCTLDVCDEEGDVVVHIPMPDRCNNGLFCDGVETCDVVRDCHAAKYVTLYQEIKARKPGWRIGWYGDPIRRDFWNSIKDRGTNEYKTWQGMNTDLGAVMAPYTDVFMPSLYFFYTRDTASSTCDYVGQYIHENIREAKRIRRMYGKLESPIYPYIWYRKHDDSRDLDADVWETIVRTVLEEADGLVLWGGWKVTAPTGPLPWDENAPWWVTIKATTDGQTTNGIGGQTFFRRFSNPRNAG
jgi:hypothetical protein